MAVIKCKMCGGELNIAESVTVAECEYCGTKQTVPVVDDEKKLKLYERANKLRINCEFDKAAGIYENIVADYPDEAEGYWGLILCRYGIEYVDDPVTGKKVPTCHRSSFDSIMDDSDFEMVMENSDAVSRLVYREEAKYIEEIRKGIIEVSGKEEPYDIFICYKETDVNGERTLDSVLAQDVYDSLTQNGYRIFFSRITLEDKLGVEYEPYIFAALNSAKIMLAFGTSYDHYNAVWVKNEWSRYLKLMAQDKSKHLIPCFKNIDAYDIPKEFAKLQAQDLGKVGAIQDLLRGIQKILMPVTKTDKVTVKETVIVNEKLSNVEPLLKRVFMFLEEEKWDSADEYCEKVLDIDPENGEAYLGKLMAELKVKKQEDLKNRRRSFEDKSNYQKAVRFADERLQAELIGYIESITSRNEKAHSEDRYNQAIGEMRGAISSADYKAAAEMFEELYEYKDSDALAKQCWEESRRLGEEGEKCNELLKEYKSAIKAEMSNKKTEIKKQLDSLNIQYENLSRVKNNWNQIEEELYSLNKNVNSLQEDIEKLNAERLSLGFLSGRRKKEIAVAIEKLENDKSLLNSKRTDLEKKKHGYNSISAISNAMEQIEQTIKTQKKALEEFQSIRPSSEIREDLKRSSLGAKLLQRADIFRKLKAGEHIGLGKYEQDNNTSNGRENIDWLVLEVRDGKALVISKYALDYQPFHAAYAEATWETCTIREWLNNEFFNKAFSEDEKNVISMVSVPAHKSPQYNTDPGNETQDQLFLLSITEANKYFSSDSERMCEPTVYAKATAYRTKDWKDQNIDKCIWMLRTPGIGQNLTTFANHFGKVIQMGTANYRHYAVRPAMWINLGD